MPTTRMSELVLQLHGTTLSHDGAGPTDAELLDRFIERRDEAAFAAIVRRHGPMVWGVCRRQLSHHADADDAFQATFLILVRKAGAIVPRGMVGNWLYGVARQTALHARRTAARRGAREVQVTEMPDIEAVQQSLWHDLLPLLDQELSGLPNNYRAVIVLCDLEGNTRREAARQLNVPEGTVAGRLARARVMLAKRLIRRGVVLPGGVLASALTQNGATAGVPASIVANAIRVASLRAAGAIPVSVADLTEGVLNTMFLGKFKAVVGVLLVVCLIGIGSAVVLGRQPGSPDTPDEPKRAEAKQVDPKRAEAKQAAALAVPPVGGGHSPEVSGLRTRLHSLKVGDDGACYARYTMFAGKGFCGKRSWDYPVALRYFDAAGKPIEQNDAGWHKCGEENFSEWAGEPVVLRFEPPAGAVFVSASLRYAGADVVTETVLLPPR